jgi:hypothetical protein
VICNSPVPGAWEVFLCERCHYSWRSTEHPNVLEKFRLDENKISAMAVNPPIAVSVRQCKQTD